MITFGGKQGPPAGIVGSTVRGLVNERVLGMTSVTEYGAVGDGATNDSAAIQAAVDAAGDAYALDGTPRLVYAPVGRFRLNQSITWRSGVGLRGAGMHDTTLLPYGGAAAIVGLDSDVDDFYEDCVFADFTIDGADQTTPAVGANSVVKGIYMRHLLRARFERVAVVNVWATGFGVDYLVESFFDSCVARNCGRGDITEFGAGSGFGIGTGAYEVETCALINCISDDNNSNGFFTEQLDAEFAEHMPRGFSMLGCSARGNNVGWLDSGSDSALISSCRFLDNLTNGVAVRRSHAITHAGRNGIIEHCVIQGSGSHGVGVGTNIEGGGLTLRNNLISDNTGAGVLTSNGVVIDGPFLVQGNTIRGNGGSGFMTAGAGAVLDRLTITGNDIFDNGHALGTYRDGITLLAPTTNLTIVDNRCFDSQETGTQRYGIALRGASTESVRPHISRNDVRGNTDGDLMVQHVVSDDSLIEGNITDAP